MIQRQPPREKRSDAKQIMAPAPATSFKVGQSIPFFQFQHPQGDRQIKAGLDRKNH
jgi:hypothetical protein